MKDFFGKIIYKIIRWKVVGGPSKSYQKYLLISEPHTSNWDFIIGLFALWQIGIPLRFVIKSEIMFFPLNIILRALGAIPIDRNKNGDNRKSNVDIIADAIDELDRGVIAISVKGTRKKVTKLKTGFYYIAKKANIPICLGYIDYKKKEIGFGETYFIHGTVEEELEKIKEFYKDKTAKHPENFV